MCIVVQLVFAATGRRFPLEVAKHQQSSSPLFFESSSLVSSSQLNCTVPTKYFVLDVVSCVESCGSELFNNATLWKDKQSYVEFFDYNTLKPLLSNEPVVDGQRLLLFTPSFLSDALEKILFSQWRKAAGDTCCLQTDEEECWRNLRQAILALEVPLSLHQKVMEKEISNCFEQFNSTTSQLAFVREGVNDSLEKIKNLNLFYSPDTPVTSIVDVKTFLTAIQQGDTKLLEVGKILNEVQSLVPAVLEAIKEEEQVANEFKNTSAWNYFSPSTSSIDTSDTSFVSTLMTEVKRKVDLVRNILCNIAKITKQTQKCRHYCHAIVGHVVLRHKKLCLLPEGLEAAKEVLIRRVILRRAIRRLLAPLETEYRAVEAKIHQFSEKWNQWLPGGFFKSVSSPLPDFYPPDDEIAREMDRYFVDVNRDETEELLTAIGVGTASSTERERAMEKRLAELEAELQRNKTALEVSEKKKEELENALRKLQASAFSLLSS